MIEHQSNFIKGHSNLSYALSRSILAARRLDLSVTLLTCDMFLIPLRILFISYDFFLFTYDILCNDDTKPKNVNILILICTN